jgi:glycosyltransferase involved in cell wall biosynthesis
MVIISNGHHKFITGPAAVEAYKNGLLTGFITGGYPTIGVKRVVSLLGLGRFASIKRLLQRQEALPSAFVHPLWLSEIIYQVTRNIARRTSTLDVFADFGLRLYAWEAEHFVRKVTAKLYHYRSGYGHNSVRIAKQKGMVTLCDHSIVHPAALDYLISNDGKLPLPGEKGTINKMWSNIHKDIDQADYILVNSDFVKETFIHFGYDSDRIFVLYTGVDDMFLSLIPSRNYNSLIEKPIKILFAGNLGTRKGGHFLIPALSRIQDLPWEFETIGSIHPNLRCDFQEFFNDERVTVTDFMPLSELARRMSMADIFLFPSLAEGSARVVFMAMACGCYVITTPNSGSIVQDETHGKIVAPGDVDELEIAIRKSFENLVAIPIIGYKNAELIKSHYTQAQYGEGLMTIYNKLMAN